MNYICTNDFPNPVGNPIVVKDFVLEDGKPARKQAPLVTAKDKAGKELHPHIHKGVVFSIGTGSAYDELAPAEKTLVAQLMVSKKIAVATPEAIRRVDKEVEADKLREERDAKLAKQMRGATVDEVLKALPDLISAATATAVSAALAAAGVTPKAKA